MEQDDKGFLWLGTYDGLNRYDGKNIRVFRHEIGNRSSLTGNVITKLHKAQKGNLWVLTTMGLDKFSTDKLCAIEHYEAIKGVRHTLVCDTLGHAFALSPKTSLCTTTPKLRYSIHTNQPAWVEKLSYCRGFMGGNNTLWLFPSGNHAYKVHFDFSNGF